MNTSTIGNPVTTFVGFEALKRTVSMHQLLEHYNLLSSLRPTGDQQLTGPCPLHAGTNILAVEIHQASGDSSDLVFDLSLDLE